MQEELQGCTDAPDAATKVKSRKGSFGNWMFNILVATIITLSSVVAYLWSANNRSHDNGYQEGKADGHALCQTTQEDNKRLRMENLSLALKIDSLTSINTDLFKQNLMLKYAGKQLEKGDFGQVIITTKPNEK